MKEYIVNRVTKLGSYIAENNTTIRKAAKKFNISKSTVHKDISERLPLISPDLAEQVKRVMDKNKAERHIRGGIATREKYMHKNIE